ncbi:unnamed protein product [Rotaria magnacalcarata]|nr:unnamed protein product [Rotaria magnacalcarata]
MNQYRQEELKKKSDQNMNMLGLTSDLSALLKKKCTLKCSGHVCSFKYKVYVLNNGYCFLIATNRKIFHRANEKISRPIRGSQRRAIMDKLEAGGSVYRVHAQYDEKTTIHGKKVLILMQLASRKTYLKK